MCLIKSWCRQMTPVLQWVVAPQLFQIRVNTIFTKMLCLPWGWGMCDHHSRSLVSDAQWQWHLHEVYVSTLQTHGQHESEALMHEVSVTRLQEWTVCRSADVVIAGNSNLPSKCCMPIFSYEAVPGSDKLCLMQPHNEGSHWDFCKCTLTSH